MNEKKIRVQEQMERLIRCNWYSRSNQRRYWTGSPWRAFRDLMK